MKVNTPTSEHFNLLAVGMLTEKLNVQKIKHIFRKSGTATKELMLI